MLNQLSCKATHCEFHIYFTSFHCTGRYELNKMTSLPMCGFTAQLVKHRTGSMEVTGSSPIEAVIFFRLLPSNCLNWKIYCDDHFSLSSTTAVQYEFHIYFTSTVCVVRKHPQNQGSMTPTITSIVEYSLFI